MTNRIHTEGSTSNCVITYPVPSTSSWTFLRPADEEPTLKDHKTTLPWTLRQLTLWLFFSHL